MKIHRKANQAMALMLVLIMAGPVALAQTQAPEQTYTPYKTIIERARDEGKARDLTLEDCVEMALRKNLNIEINRYNPLLRQEQLNAALGVYNFALTSDFGYRKSESANTRVYEQVSGSTNTDESYSWQNRLTRYMPYGGNFTFNLNNSRSASNANVGSLLFNGNFSLSYTQPLWRDFRVDAQRRGIYAARRNMEISHLDFENQVATTIQSVESTYWDLVNAIEQQKIDIQSRELALIQLRDNQKRVEIGTLAPINITQTRSEVARAEQNVIAGEASIIRQQNLLKNLIANSPQEELWSQVILPTTRPEITISALPLPQALEAAMKNRPEIRKLNIEQDLDNYDINFYVNQTKPTLDFVAGYGSTGFAGPYLKTTLRDQNGDPVLGPDGQPILLDTPYTGGLGKVYEQMIKQKFINYSFAMHFEYTFGNDAAKANLATARIQQNQTQSTMRQTLQQVQAEVTDSIQSIEVNKRSLDTAVVARQFQEEQLDGQNKRFQAGLTTNFEVLQTQRDLANARAAELNARIQLKKSYLQLQRSTFSLISDSQIRIAAEGSNK